MIYIQIFIIAFLLNFVWEFWHCRLYNEIHKMSLNEVTYLLTKMSFKDGFYITLFYAITVFFFENLNIFENYRQLAVFLILALLFSFVDEKISLKMGRWSYTKSMPTILGAGITPLFEVVVTGTLAFAIVFLFIDTM
jgi:hypothetical protein